MQDSMCDLLLARAVTVQTFAQRDIAGGDDGNDAGLVVTHITVGLLLVSLYEKKSAPHNLHLSRILSKLMFTRT